MEGNLVEADPKNGQTGGPNDDRISRIEAAGRVLARHAADLLGEDDWLGRTAVIELLGAAANVASGMQIEDVEDQIDIDLMTRMAAPSSDCCSPALMPNEIEGLLTIDMPQHRRFLSTILELRSELELMSRQLAEVRQLVQTQRG